MSRLDLFDFNTKTKELCFDETEFLKDDFSLNKFLKKHNRAIFDTLRDDLGSYLKSLRHSTIELINQDYEDFVNLSTDLIGLDKAINSIETPLDLLKEEVLSVKSGLEETMTGLQCCLQEYKRLRERKRSLQHLTQVNRSLTDLKVILLINNDDAVSLDHIERAAVEYSQLQYSMSKCLADIPTAYKNEIDNISRAIVSVLNNRFLEYLCEKQTDELTRCLRIYAGLDHVKTLELFISEEVISPALHTFFKAKPLELRKAFENILQFIDTQFFELLFLTCCGNRGPTVHGYNFIVNSLWPVLEKKLEFYSDTLFAPGDPDRFHSRFTESVLFLNELEERCGSQAAASEFRSHPLYQQFLQKWNLQIYFKIRFSQIANKLEQGLDEDDLYLTQNGGVSGETGLHLKSSNHVLKCLKMGWQDDVFIYQLSHMFWKLTLQIVARYRCWISQFLTEETVSRHKKQTANQTSTVKELNLNFYVCLFLDITMLANNIPNILQIEKKFSNSQTIQNKLKQSLQLSVGELKKCLPLLSNKIVNLIVKDCVVYIKQVSAIPRYFRRTNRELPTEASSYIQDLLEPARQFYQTRQSTVPTVTLNNWLTCVFSIINDQLYQTVNEVLVNIQKTEESLRNLKKIRNKGVKENDNKIGISDDHKIREQLLLDVKEFDRSVARFGVNVNRTSELVKLVENAMSVNDKL